MFLFLRYYNVVEFGQIRAKFGDNRIDSHRNTIGEVFNYLTMSFDFVRFVIQDGFRNMFYVYFGFDIIDRKLDKIRVITDLT